VKVRGAHDTAVLKKAAFAELERIESTLSHWRPDSFTSQFNASETTLATEQPAELIALVARAQELSELTEGAYDISVAPLVDAWGFGTSGEKTTPPSDPQIQELLSAVGWQKLVVDADANTLRKTHRQLQIDLGSMLQGYAADRVAHLFAEAGVREFLVEVGGELFARGSWEVAIEDPRDPSRNLVTFTLADSGLATSGVYRAVKQLDSTPTHHLISPQTGRPIEATASLAAVVAPTALEADAWSTALLAVGLPGGLNLAERRDLAALLLDFDHQLHRTSQGARFFGDK
jgi:thiamine biosynthesis lipoprotein